MSRIRGSDAAKAASTAPLASRRSRRATEGSKNAETNASIDGRSGTSSDSNQTSLPPTTAETRDDVFVVRPWTAEIRRVPDMGRRDALGGGLGGATAGGRPRAARGGGRTGAGR